MLLLNKVVELMEALCEDIRKYNKNNVLSDDMGMARDILYIEGKNNEDSVSERVFAAIRHFSPLLYSITCAPLLLALNAVNSSFEFASSECCNVSDLLVSPIAFAFCLVVELGISAISLLVEISACCVDGVSRVCKLAMKLAGNSDLCQVSFLNYPN